jgi:hypothetical protein
MPTSEQNAWLQQTFGVAPPASAAVAQTAALKRRIADAQSQAERALDAYEEQQKLNKDQWFVSGVSRAAKAVTSLGRFEDPGSRLKQTVAAVREGAKSASAALDAGDIAKATAIAERIAILAQNSARWAHGYTEGMIEGAETSTTAIKTVDTGAKVVGAVAITVATAGGAAPAVIAAATGVSVAGGMAASTAGVATKLALGEKVDWGMFSIDILIQALLARFGGPLGEGIAAAVAKRLGPSIAKTLGGSLIKSVVTQTVMHVDSAVLRTAIESSYQKLSGKDLTYRQVLQSYVALLTDPNSLVVIAATTAAGQAYAGRSSSSPASTGKAPASTEASSPAQTPPKAAATPAAATSGAAPVEEPAAPAAKSAAAEAPTTSAMVTTEAASGAPTPPGKPQPPKFKDTKRHALADFDKETAGTGGIKSIEKRADADGLYGVAIEGELKDPIPREKAPNYNGSDKLIDPEGPGLNPEDWEKAHLVGPGFGDEAAAGLMNAPKEMNQFYQNRGVEGWMRDLHSAVKAVGGRVTYKAKAVAWDFPVKGWKPSSGAEFLKIVEYDVVVDIPGRPKQPIRIAIETAPPPQAKVISISIEPEGAANPADLLAGL